MHVQEKSWQADTRQVLLEADAKAADRLEASLAAQRRADAAEANQGLRHALTSQRKEHEVAVRRNTRTRVSGVA
jgi:hypothetical protein